ncbi:MAG: aldose 1-epimerase family protein [Victivallaceae bacterium]|nr:aldose 1-epimerase family protein [Victivallaceae bacterium]
MKNAQNIRPYLGSARQLGAIRNLEIADGPGRGMRLLDVDNGSGLHFSVYPDRALDIGEASFMGTPFVWLPNSGAAAPAFYDADGIEWLRTWGGGMLTSCGYLNVGGPGVAGNEKHGLHGRVSHLPATGVSLFSGWENGRYVFRISGEVRHARVFGENLLLRRTISTAHGENTVTIEDRVVNEGFSETPFLQLMHMNFGWPLVSEAARLEADAHKVDPQNEIAARDLEHWAEMTPPQPGFVEEVFYHHLDAGTDGFAGISLVNPEEKIRLRVDFRKKELPYLVEWKMMGQGEYVLGLEPANCLPEGQAKNAEKGTLRRLAPGEESVSVVRVSLSAL